MVKMFEYKLDGEKYNVEVVLKNNKNTYIKIKDDLTILVTTNVFVSKRMIKGALDREQDFLRDAIAKEKRRIEKDSQFYYLGQKYDIIKVPFNTVEFDDSKIFASDDACLDKWLKCKTKEIFEERLNYCYGLFEENIPFPKLKIRKMKTRWGVCNRRDLSITLNSKLIRYELFVIDYVIIHELSHLVHFDHSRDFWMTVCKYMPDYKMAVNVLKD